MPHGYLPSQCSCAVPVLVSIFTPRITSSEMTLQTSLEFLIYLRTPAGYKHTPYRLFGNPLEIKFYTIALHLMSLIMNTRLGHKLFCDITISLIYIYLPLILYLPLCAIITSFMRASARELLVPYFTPLVYCGHHIQSINLKRMLYQMSYQGKFPTQQASKHKWAKRGGVEVLVFAKVDRACNN